MSKTYRVFESLVDQALDVFGLNRLRFWKSPVFSEVHALRQLDLEVSRGDRLAILGRNGAGKTTLLKLITGNFAATSGSVQVNGSVQALMNVGLGFHPEFTGRENLRSSLLYNGLPEDRFEEAMRDVVSFAELGSFLDQPVKNYSLGMKARLMFAAATAVQPDILIVDEVLGAGDAYFAGKSAARMKRLVHSGCTVLIVSHSMQDVLQYCDRAVWLEKGQVVMQGDALRVVKAYEEFIHEMENRRRVAEEASPDAAASAAPAADTAGSDWMDERILEHVLGEQSAREYRGARGALSAGGASRWRGEDGLRIRSVAFRDGDGREAAVVRTGASLRVELEMEAEKHGVYPGRCFLALFDDTGRWISRFASPAFELELEAGERKSMALVLDPVLLGNGEYLWSAAIYRELDLGRVSSSRYYDILTRSFRIRVVDEHRDDPAILHHPHHWLPGE